MGRFCGYKYKSGGSGGGTRVAGIILMVIGLLMFLIFVPKWVWTSALGIVLISVGFLLWRFGN
ncbi:MAG: hypothetical protein IJ769_02095 [Clostridia bacterium]|nr:hypothetical protein [Clostridia bacterium]